MFCLKIIDANGKTAALARGENEVNLPVTMFQEIGLCDDEEMGTFLFSVDGYYRRTKQRDADYERRFRKRQDVDGQRIPVGTYIREYVD